jgi:predicted metal-dependent HD superfamily phosphohydrolase
MTRFHEGWRQLVQPDHVAWTTRLFECLYSSPGRVYHTLAHVDACLTLLDELDLAAPVDRPLVTLALIGHDMVYVPGNPDNEVNSVAMIEGLRFTLVSPILATHTVPLIFATRHKDEGGAFADVNVAVTVDIDLAVLGCGEPGYTQYVDAIRREYSHASDEAWRVGRASFLSQMLRRKRIYTLEPMRARFEAQARANMLAELRAMGSS